MIDPGHGGSDLGFINDKYDLIEKDFTLAVAKRVKELLPSNYTIYLTREDDIDVSVKRRVSFANDIKANVFVSIHLNESWDKSINGFRIFYYHSFYRAKVLANTISRQFSKLKKIYPDYKYLGTRTDNCYELMLTSMPAVIVKAGFISGDKDAKWLSNRKNWEHISFYISQGIRRYIEWEVKEYGELYYSA